MKIDFEEIFKEYEIDDDIFCDESPKVKALKYVIFNDLSEIERRVILLYAEEQSQRKVAKLLGISPGSVNIVIKGIRKKILDNLC